jgi:hypothetical protein
MKGCTRSPVNPSVDGFQRSFHQGAFIQCIYNTLLLVYRRGDYYCCGTAKAIRMRKDRYIPMMEPIMMRRIIHHCILVDCSDGGSLFFMKLGGEPWLELEL